MCGFSGIINDEDFNQHEIKSINELLNHRGPDSTNYFQSKVDKFNIYLGHKRLSIIDLSEQANQPMKFEELAMLMLPLMKHQYQIFDHLVLRINQNFSH